MTDKFLHGLGKAKKLFFGSYKGFISWIKTRGLGVFDKIKGDL